MSLYTSLYIQLREKTNPLFGPFRRKALKYPTFTIISNNCWAGHVYRYFQLSYNTPTIGLYFFANDYVKFVTNLKYYLDLDLTFIRPEESKHYSFLHQRGDDRVPIGRLKDIEIIFLHYKTEEEAYAKWNRRKARMDWNNLYFKFSEMNSCTGDDLKTFDTLATHNKFVFVSKPHNDIASAIYYPGFEKEGEIKNDTTYFHHGLDLIKFLNKE